MSQPDKRDKRYPIDSFLEDLLLVCKSLGVAVVTFGGLGKEKKGLAEETVKLINSGNTGLRADMSRVPGRTEPPELYQISIITPTPPEE